jgi:hypothetical protein
MEARAVISDLDVYRCAQMVLRQHGDEAALFAAERADALLAAGDMEGQSVWKRVLRAVVELRQRQLVANQNLN